MIGHLHDDVILLLRPESFRILLSCAILGGPRVQIRAFVFETSLGFTKLEYKRKNDRILVEVVK